MALLPPALALAVFASPTDAALRRVEISDDGLERVELSTEETTAATPAAREGNPFGLDGNGPL